MQDDYSLCHGDLLVMNGGTGGVCWQAGVAVGSVAGLHRGRFAPWPLCQHFTLCRCGGRDGNRLRSTPPGQQPFCKLFWVSDVVFLEHSLLPCCRYYHPAVDAEAREEACRELVAFHPISGLVVPS